MNYYKLTKEQAQNLGRFEYEPKKFFDALACEQKDGTYLVGENVVEFLKDNNIIKTINWNIIQKTNVLDIKTTNLIK